MARLNVRSVSFLLQILFLTNILLLVDSQDCVQNGLCRCDFENGTYIDLASAKQQFYEAPSIQALTDMWRMLTYYFSPCSNMDMPNSIIKNECIKSTVCSRDIDMTNIPPTSNYSATDSGFQKLAEIEKAKFSSSNGKTYIKYADHGITITIELICFPGEPFLTVPLPDPKDTVLRFYSPSACLTGTAYTRHSFGTTLLIIFFVLTTVYIILGCCVKYFLMGARGPEIIPNINFWRDLPNLIRDGLIFVQNGFKPPPQPSTSGTPVQNPNPNSYDSI